MEPIEPSESRYIKLGRGGRWEEISLERGEIHFGHGPTRHEIATSGDWDAVTRFYVEEQGKSRGKAKDIVREIRAFYTLGEDCLWITFARDHLWWVFAEPKVRWLGGDGSEHGERMRRTAVPWRNSDILGKPLRVNELSTKLTQLASYRQTICSVREETYLLRRINAVPEPAVVRAREARETMIDATAEMITSLHWADFETMVDLIFSRAGWQRVSRLGGTQKDVDLVLEQPTTGERAFVQVKSKASQSVLSDYQQRFAATGSYDRMFFVCHSPTGKLDAGHGKAVHLWIGSDLAQMAVKAGLYDWLIERVK